MSKTDIDFLQAFFAVVSFLATIYAVVVFLMIRRKRHRQVSVNRKHAHHMILWLLVVYLGIILQLGNIGLFYWRDFGPGAVPGATIAYPKAGSAVEIEETVEGSSWRIPARTVLRLVVYSAEERLFFPQEELVSMSTNGEWTCQISIGIEEDVRRDFDIVVVYADQKAQDAFDAYSLTSKASKRWEGIKAMPKSAKELTRIQVNRK